MDFVPPPKFNPTALPASPFAEQVPYLTIFATSEQVSANLERCSIGGVKEIVNALFAAWSIPAIGWVWRQAIKPRVFAQRRNPRSIHGDARAVPDVFRALAEARNFKLLPCHTT